MPRPEQAGMDLFSWRLTLPRGGRWSRRWCLLTTGGSISFRFLAGSPLMPSLNLDLDYLTNRKVLRLVGLLGPEAFIIPIRLWLYVAKNHPETGRLKGYSIREIESILNWTGQPGTCVKALATTRMMNRDRGKQWSVNDWSEHAGHLIFYKRRASLAAKARWAKLENASSNATSIDASSNASAGHLISTHYSAEDVHEKPSAPAKKPAELTDEQWIVSLQESPAYASLNVKILYEKCRQYFLLRKIVPTRRRFINWLNREDKGMLFPLNQNHVCQVMVLRTGYPAAVRCNDPAYIPKPSERQPSKPMCAGCYGNFLKARP